LCRESDNKASTARPRSIRSPSPLSQVSASISRKSFCSTSRSGSPGGDRGASPTGPPHGSRNSISPSASTTIAPSEPLGDCAARETAAAVELRDELEPAAGACVDVRGEGRDLVLQLRIGQSRAGRVLSFDNSHVGRVVNASDGARRGRLVARTAEQFQSRGEVSFADKDLSLTAPASALLG
jgi:hypothetical protein